MNSLRKLQRPTPPNERSPLSGIDSACRSMAEARMSGRLRATPEPSTESFDRLRNPILERLLMAVRFRAQQSIRILRTDPGIRYLVRHPTLEHFRPPRLG